MSGLFLFWGRWARNPKSIGAVAPSGSLLARAMVGEIPRDPVSQHLPIIELGGGTGSITEKLLANGIQPSRLFVVERDGRLAQHLRRRFSSVQVVHGDAGDLPNLLRPHGVEHAAAIVSGLPLLLFPQSALDDLIAGSFKLLGRARPFIQFTYGARSPLPNRYGLLAKRTKRIWANMPPAMVWTYTMPGNTHMNAASD